MSVGRFLQQGAAGNAGEAVYADDVFSTYLYDGTGSDAYPVQEIAITGNSVTSVTGLAFKSDGTKMYATSGVTATPGILEFDLSTAWDVTTATYSQFGTTYDVCTDLWIDSTGTKVFITSTASNTVAYYTLSTAWDISTISSRLATRSTSGEGENNPQFIFLKPDGTELYYGGTDTDSVFQLGLSTAFDLSTASHDATFSVASQETLPFALVFNSTGTRMFVIGNSNETVYQYNLSTGWDLSSASYNSSCPTGQNLTPSGMRINDGKLFILFNQNPGQYKAYSMTDSDEIATVARNVITNGIDLAGEGGMIWTKERSPTARNHYIGDSERNNFRNYLYPNLTNAQSGLSGAGYDISSVSSTGYSLGPDNYTFNNESGSNQVSWTFRKQPGFFDVVTYTGNGVAGTEIAHSLGSTPGMIVVKTTGPTFGGAWRVWHRSVSTSVLRLNTTDGTSAIGNPQNTWGNDSSVIQPTSTHFTIGSESDVNRNGAGYVAYLFAHDAQDFGTGSDESIIKCGSFTASDGTNVELGFEPQWIMVKSSTSATDWYMFDNMRGWGADQGSNDQWIYANASNAEVSNTNSLGFHATGFTAFNGGAQTYIYVAIRRPHKPASEFAATDLFDDFKYKDNTLVQTDNPIQLTSDRQTGGPAVLTDMWWHALRGTTYPAGKSNSFFINSRLQGAGKGMITNGTNAEPAGDASEMRGYDRMTGVEVGPNGTFYYYSTAAGNRDHISYYFRRAPGFFDVVAYTGTGSAQNISHNLNAVPEMLVVKARSTTGNWMTYHSGLNGGTNPEGYYAIINGTNAQLTDGSGAVWNNTAPTSSQFSVKTASFVNGSGTTYVAYLFATVPGISKVGSYSGTGSAVDVDCGFTSGARFVLVKRTDSTGDWYVWDSARGIVAGNDGYLLLNSNAAEVTSTDYIDPLSSGFTITSTAPAALNASGGTYIFLAIA